MKKETKHMISGIIIGIIIIGAMFLIYNSTKEVCRDEQIPYEEDEEYTIQEPYTDYEYSSEEVSEVTLDTKGVLFVDADVVDMTSGQKMQWKVLCFDIPQNKKVRGEVSYGSPLWWMISDRTEVECQTSMHTGEPACGYKLGYAQGSSDTYKSFDFGWTGNDELCLSMSGRQEGDAPITYDVSIETYGAEGTETVVIKYRDVTKTRTITKYKTERICS